MAAAAGQDAAASTWKRAVSFDDGPIERARGRDTAEWITEVSCALRTARAPPRQPRCRC